MSDQFPSDFVFSFGHYNSGYITFETLYEFPVNDFDAWLNTNNIVRPVIIFTDWHQTRAIFFSKDTNRTTNYNDRPVAKYNTYPAASRCGSFWALKAGVGKGCQEIY